MTELNFITIPGSKPVFVMNGNPNAEKDLIIRLSNEMLFVKLDHAKMAIEHFTQCFAPHFKSVKVYSTCEQGEILDNFLKSKGIKKESIVSLDSCSGMVFPYTANISRNFNLEGEFIGYVVRPEDRTFGNLPSNQQVYIYDHDVVYGGQFRFLKDMLEKFGCKVANNYVFFKVDPATTELLDSKDFLSEYNHTGGIVIEGTRYGYNKCPPKFQTKLSSIDNLEMFNSALAVFTNVYKNVYRAKI